MPDSPLQIAIVGGGAAGFFAAIACAEALGPRGRVTIFEASPKPLAKVRISGGGRCNVTNARTEPRELVAWQVVHVESNRQHQQPLQPQYRPVRASLRAEPRPRCRVSGDDLP